MNFEFDANELAKQIKIEMQRQNLTCSDLEARSGLSQPQISRFLAAKVKEPSIISTVKIAKALKVPLSVLIKDGFDFPGFLKVPVLTKTSFEKIKISSEINWKDVAFQNDLINMYASVFLNCPFVTSPFSIGFKIENDLFSPAFQKDEIIFIDLMQDKTEILKNNNFDGYCFVSLKKNNRLFFSFKKFIVDAGEVVLYNIRQGNIESVTDQPFEIQGRCVGKIKSFS